MYTYSFQNRQSCPGPLPPQLHSVQRGLLAELFPGRRTLYDILDASYSNLISISSKYSIPGRQQLSLERSQAQWRKALGLDQDLF